MIGPSRPRAPSAPTDADPGVAAVGWCLGVAVALAPAAGVAEFEATAAVEAPDPVDHPDDATAAVARIETDDRPAAVEGVPDLLLEVPGARVLSTGGAGAFSGLSLRGAEADQTRVYLGDLPLDGPDGGAFDLSTLALEAFEAVEVARGPAPAWWSEGAIGGVLRLAPRRDPTPTLTLFGGSFGHAGIAAAAGAAPAGDDGPALSTAVRVERAENDFPYVDDQLTTLDPGDDVERPRRNADALDATALVHGSAPAGRDGRLEATLVGFVREGGAPGPGGRDTRDARRGVSRVAGSAAYRVDRPDGARWQLALGGGHERRRLDDPLGELGGFTRYDDRLGRAFARAAVSAPAADWLTGTAVATWRWDGQSSAVAGVAGGQRHTGAVVTEARLAGEVNGVPVEVRPSLRLEISRTRLDDPAPRQEDTRTVVAPTGRLGVAVRPADGWVISASAGTGTRLPSLLELFGDRVLRLGDPGLEPERAVSTDAGVAGRLRAGPVRIRGEIRGFLRLERDAIVYARSTDGWLRPENVGRARVLGLEGRARVGLGDHVVVLGTLTALHAVETGLDAALPYRPPLAGYARAEGRIPGAGPLDGVRPYVDVAAVGETAVDLAGLATLPARAHLGLGVRVTFLGGRWGLALSVRDLLDRRGPDLVGFPLPGRRFAASVTWRGGP